jgi:hypothetical protein
MMAMPGNHGAPSRPFRMTNRAHWRTDMGKADRLRRLVMRDQSGRFVRKAKVR